MYSNNEKSKNFQTIPGVSSRKRMCVHVHACLHLRSKERGISSKTNRVWQNYLEAKSANERAAFWHAVANHCFLCHCTSFPLAVPPCDVHDMKGTTELSHPLTQTHTGWASDSCSMEACAYQLVSFCFTGISVSFTEVFPINMRGFPLKATKPQKVKEILSLSWNWSFRLLATNV